MVFPMLGCSSRQESRKTKIESEVWRVEKDSATKRPEIGVLLGSASDLDSVEPAFQILQDLQIPYEVAVISAHRTPHLLSEYASTAKGRHQSNSRRGGAIGSPSGSSRVVGRSSRYRDSG